jgi:hypothetical protein
MKNLFESLVDLENKNKCGVCGLPLYKNSNYCKNHFYCRPLLYKGVYRTLKVDRKTGEREIL